MTPIPSTQSQITLINRPIGLINPDLHSGTGTFKLNSHASVTKVSELKSNEVIVQVEFCSLDPAMRGWLNDSRSYIPPVKIGAVMRAGGVGKIVALGEGVKGFNLGDWTYGEFGWQEYATVKVQNLNKLNLIPGLSPSVYLGALGMPSQTAFHGTFDVLKIKKGETVVVSGAAGAVGTIVVQLAKIKGCNVIAIAGGPDKCAWLKSEFKVDHALDYKSSTFKSDFKKSLNGGYVDCYFDNVGGEILDMVLTKLQKGARIAICGAISEYNNPTPKGITNYLNLISQRAKIEGFIVFDYASQYATAEKELAAWIKSGELKVKETQLIGLDKCVDGLMGLFKGENYGKLVVKIGGGGGGSKL